MRTGNRSCQRPSSRKQPAAQTQGRTGAFTQPDARTPARPCAHSKARYELMHDRPGLLESDSLDGNSCRFGSDAQRRGDAASRCIRSGQADLVCIERKWRAIIRAHAGH